MLISDFKSIVINSTPLIDVRSPVEFKKGSLPNAVNLPLMSDKERHEVGICYQQYGNEAALKLGYSLVSGAVKEDRIKAWLNFINSNQNAKLFCFRGGQRSKISQNWLHDSGCDILRLEGGYKAFRSYLIDKTEESLGGFKPFLLGGYTGSGKTILLNGLKNSIDLEGLANHRGSSFGRKTTPQPAQIDFENSLAYNLIQKLDTGLKYLIFEDEGNHVGNLYIPKNLVDYLSKAPLLILQTPIDERVDITFDEYITQSQKIYNNKLELWEKEMIEAINRIKKRLGSKRHKDVCEIFENAFTSQMQGGSADAHKEWIKILLLEYYDPMYNYQIKKRVEQVEFMGSKEEIVEYISHLNNEKEIF